MASVFDGFDASLSEAVMEVFGETEAAILRPRVSAQYAARAVDVNRPSATVFGVFSDGPGGGDFKGQATSNLSGTTRRATAQAEFWVPAEAIAALSEAVVVGDLIEFPSRAGSPSYAISATQESDTGDLNLILVREDQAV